MSERPDWLLPWFPELREGPPWVTEEMVEAEAGLAGLVESLASPASELADAALRGAEAGSPVVVSGSGTAEMAAAGLGELLDDALRQQGLRGGSVEVRESLEAALDPRAGGVFVGVSHGGRTWATVSALEAARERGAFTFLVTAAPEAPAADSADHVVVTPLRDASFCHTVAYLQPILVGGAATAAIARARISPALVAAHLRAALETRPQCAAVAARLHGVHHLLAVGGGADTIAARELALKLEEAVRLPSSAQALEAVLHGHLVATDGTTGLVLLVTDPRSREARADRGECVLAAARRIGLRTAAMTTPDLADRFGPELASAGVVVVPEAAALPGLLSSLVATAIGLQLLTLALVREAGVNPDLIRREEEPYRVAAELARAKIR